MRYLCVSEAGIKRLSKLPKEIKAISHKVRDDDIYIYIYIYIVTERYRERIKEISHKVRDDDVMVCIRIYVLFVCIRGQHQDQLVLTRELMGS